MCCSKTSSGTPLVFDIHSFTSRAPCVWSHLYLHMIKFPDNLGFIIKFFCSDKRIQNAPGCKRGPRHKSPTGYTSRARRPPLCAGRTQVPLWRAATPPVENKLSNLPAHQLVTTKLPMHSRLPLGSTSFPECPQASSQLSDP